MKLLSICLPTYNRAELLQEALTALLSNIGEDERNLIEVVISDNASPDSTPQVIAKFVQSRPDVTFQIVRQPQNTGFTNIVLVTKYATGKYVWIISDDDLVQPKAIRRILDVLLANQDLAAVVPNTAAFSTVNRVLGKPYFFHTREILFDPDEALVTLGTQITFLSVMVFRRDFAPFVESPQRMESSFGQSYLFLDSMRMGKILFLPDICLGFRSENTGGYSFYHVFISAFEEILDYALKIGFRMTTIRQVKLRHLRFLASFTRHLIRRGGYGEIQVDFLDAIQRLRLSYNYTTYPFALLLELYIRYAQLLAKS